MRIRIILIIQKSAHKFSGVPKIRISAEPGHPAFLNQNGANFASPPKYGPLEDF